jgi:hypothetical protein
MSDTLKYHPEHVGAGSGGDGGDGNVTSYTDGAYCIVTPQTIVHAVGAEGAADVTDPSGFGLTPNISLLAGEVSAPDGVIYARGRQGVRITAGPPLLPPMKNDEIDGVDIQVGDTQEIRFMQGVDSTQMMVFAAGGITVSGTTSIMIQCDEEITLQVAGGLSSITLGPSGIVIKGLVVQIN